MRESEPPPREILAEPPVPNEGLSVVEEATAATTDEEEEGEAAAGAGEEGAGEGEAAFLAACWAFQAASFSRFACSLAASSAETDGDDDDEVPGKG
jgi:hypothetical protein